MRLTHVEGAVLGRADSPVTARIEAALGSILAQVRRIEPAPGASELAAIGAALATCGAHALLFASESLPDLDPRAALALVAAMPARGGPELVAFERGGRADLRLALLRADCAGNLAGRASLSDAAVTLDSLLVPAEWLE